MDPRLRGDDAKASLLLAVLEGGAQDVAERSARVRRPIGGDRFLLLGDFQRLDGEGDLAGLAVVLGDARVNLLTLGEALRALVVAVAAQIGAADERRHLRIRAAHFDAAIVDLGDGAGHDRALLEAVAGRVLLVAGGELLDAERNTLLLDIDVEHLGLDDIATVVLVERLLARLLPVEVGEVNHAVHVAVETDEQTELGLVLDLALDGRADRELLGEGLPRVGEGLLETQRDAALVGIDLEHHDFHLLRGGDDLARVDVLLGPAHFRNVDQAFDARLQFDERTVVGDVCHAARELAADRIFGGCAFPGIALELLHAEADALRVAVDADDLR